MNIPFCYVPRFCASYIIYWFTKKTEIHSDVLRELININNCCFSSQTWSLWMLETCLFNLYMCHELFFFSHTCSIYEKFPHIKQPGKYPCTQHFWWILNPKHVLFVWWLMCVFFFPSATFPPEPTFDPSVANCDFEENLCRYYQEQFGGSVWNRVSVRPNVYRIGDHTNGEGMWWDVL